MICLNFNVFWTQCNGKKTCHTAKVLQKFSQGIDFYFECFIVLRRYEKWISKRILKTIKKIYLLKIYYIISLYKQPDYEDQNLATKRIEKYQASILRWAKNTGNFELILNFFTGLCVKDSCKKNSLAFELTLRYTYFCEQQKIIFLDGF